jgi:hypothetical protein
MGLIAGAFSIPLHPALTPHFPTGGYISSFYLSVSSWLTLFCFFLAGGGGFKSKTYLLPLEMEYNIVRNLYVKNNVVHAYQKRSK